MMNQNPADTRFSKMRFWECGIHQRELTAFVMHGMLISRMVPLVRAMEKAYTVTAMSAVS